MAITLSSQTNRKSDVMRLNRFSQTSAANASNVVVTESGTFQRLVSVSCAYSAAVTVSVEIVIDSGADAAYDTILQVASLVAQTDMFFVPDMEIILAEDDVLQVTAPAGGDGITSAVTIYTETI